MSQNLLKSKVDIFIPPHHLSLILKSHRFRALKQKAAEATKFLGAGMKEQERKIDTDERIFRPSFHAAS